jgi:hypothetical protein
MVLNRVMCEQAGEKHAPPWAKALAPMGPSPEQAKWSAKFRARWSRLSPDRQFELYGTSDQRKAEDDGWQRFRTSFRLRFGRETVRSGRFRCICAEITAALQSRVEGETLCAALHIEKLNAIALGRSLNARLVDAPINGLALRSARRRDNIAEYWITSGRSK